MAQLCKAPQDFEEVETQFGVVVICPLRSMPLYFEVLSAASEVGPLMYHFACMECHPFLQELYRSIITKMVTSETVNKKIVDEFKLRLLKHIKTDFVKHYDLALLWLFAVNSRPQSEVYYMQYWSDMAIRFLEVTLCS